MSKKNKNRKRKRSSADATAEASVSSNVTPEEQNSESIKADREVIDRETEKPAVDRENGNVADTTAESNQASRKRKKRKKKKRKSNADPSVALKQDETKEEEIDNSAEPKSVAPDFPYPTDSDDHCESPLYAYQHVVSILKMLYKPESIIYDPYYCDGGVVRNLNSLGFPNIHNVKEDCYAIWQRQDLPSFDILVTNPPYSGDHIERLMKFVTSARFGKRPWLLLLPNWVHKKDYFLEATKNIRPFYLVPRKRYVYEPPKNFREAKKSDVHKKSSPFVSMWYIWGGTDAVNEQLIRRFTQSTEHTKEECDLARSKSALRDLRRKKR